MSPRSIRFTLAIGALTLAGCQIEEATDSTSSNANGCTLETYQSEMLNQLNEARATARDCGATRYAATQKLTYQCDLDSAAERHSKDMANNNFYSHTGTDDSSIGERVNDTGYSWSTVGENIAAGQTSVDQVMQGWLESEGHCKNIMNDNYEEFGTSRVTNETAQYDHYWTQVFGTSR